MSDRPLCKLGLLFLSYALQLEKCTIVSSHQLHVARRAAAEAKMIGTEAPGDLSSVADVGEIDGFWAADEKMDIEYFHDMWRETPGRFEWEKERIDLEVTNFELNTSYQQRLFLKNFAELERKLFERGLKVLDDENSVGEEIATQIDKRIKSDFRPEYFKAKGSYENKWDDSRHTEYDKDDPVYEVAEMIQPEVAYRAYVAREKPGQLVDPLSELLQDDGYSAAAGAGAHEEAATRDDRMTVIESMLGLTHMRTDDGKTWVIQPEMLAADPDEDADPEKAKTNRFNQLKPNDRLVNKFSVPNRFLNTHENFGVVGSHLSAALYPSFPVQALPPLHKGREEEILRLGFMTRLKTREADLHDQGEILFHMDGAGFRLLITTQGPATVFLQQ